MTKNRRGTAAFWAVLVLCVALSGCAGKSGAEENGSTVPDLELVPIDTGSQTETDGPGKEESGASEQPSGRGETSPAPADSGSSEQGDEPAKPGESEQGEIPASAPEVSFEILKEVRTDEAGEEMVFAEYPVFSVAGTGYESLSAAFASISEEYRADNAALLDELEGSIKDYREFVDPAAVFGQGTVVSITRCDTEVISFLVIRTVTMGGPHPNNYWDYYNLNAATGEHLQLSDFITMDDAMVETVIERLHENYPEVEFDDGVLRKEIPEAFAAKGIGWCFSQGQICLAFPEGSFGFGHAVGSLEVTID